MISEPKGGQVHSVHSRRQAEAPLCLDAEVDIDSEQDAWDVLVE